MPDPTRTFGGFELDLERARLVRDGVEVELEPRAFDLLRYLAAHAERLVTKEELMREVWQARSLSGGVTANAVAKLRRALGQGPAQNTPIETVHGRGYRFHFDDRSAPVELDPFVGRKAALDALHKRLERAHAGKGSLVLIAGDAGIGKTRVARELALRAERPTSFFVGISHDGEGAPPYWAWTQILREVSRELGPALPALLPAGACAIQQLLPELGEPARGEPQAVRFRLFDEVARLLDALSARRTLILLFDDLQWADPATVELLAFCARTLQQRPILFLATVRDGGTRFASLGRLATTLTLGGLSADEVGALADALGFESDRVQALHARTGGNPFFVRQLLEWPERELPPAVRDVIRGKLASLPEAVRQTLAVASVLGQQFVVSRLSAVQQLAQEELLDRLELALVEGLVERQPGTESFAFSHALLRETLYDDLAVRERGLLHARIAELLTSAEPDRLGELAHHLLHALPSQLDEAVRACRRAALAAHEAAGFESASRFLTLAIDKLRAEHGDPVLHAELLLELGDNHLYVAELEPAWEAYRGAARLARDAGDVQLLARIAPRMVDVVDIGVGSVSETRDVIEHVLRALPEGPQRAIMLAQKAELAYELPPGEREALLDRAEQLAQSSPAVTMEVAHSRAILRDPTSLAANAEAAERVLALMDEHPSEADNMRYRSLRRFTPRLTLYLSALTACDLAAADVQRAKIRELAQASHVRAIEVYATVIDAGRALGDGRLSELEQTIAGWGGFEASDFSLLNEAFRSYQFLIAEARDQLAQFAALDPPALPGDGRGKPRQRTDIAIVRAYFYARTGRLERAQSYLAQVPAGDLARMPVLYGDLGILCLLAELYIALDRRSDAEPLFAKLEPFAAYNAVLPTFAYRGAVAHYLGVLAHFLGRPAHTYFDRARAINERMGMPLLEDAERSHG
ncbi:MAG TPA: AAA family ATPase [Polyangiales bacterium]